MKLLMQRDIVRLTGLKPRQVQVWCDAGVLLPEQTTDGAGTGVHRLYAETEVYIAMIFARLVRAQIRTNTLKHMADIVRTILYVPKSVGFPSTVAFEDKIESILRVWGQSEEGALQELNTIVGYHTGNPRETSIRDLRLCRDWFYFRRAMRNQGDVEILIKLNQEGVWCHLIKGDADIPLDNTLEEEMADWTAYVAIVLPDALEVI